MAGLNAPSFMANGNIYPAAFVKLDTTSAKNFQVIQCVGSTGGTTANSLADRPIGISQDASYGTPGLQNQGTLDAAAAGQPIQVFGEADVCLLQISTTAGVTAGDYLTPDPAAGAGTKNGFGLTIAFTQTVADATHGIFHGAVSLETAA